MYLYYNKRGKLKEIINDEALRQGNYGVNTLYIYVEERDYSSIDISYLLPSGLIVGPQNYNTFTDPEAEDNDDCYIPFDAKRDLKYFKYYRAYKFLVVNLEEDINGNGPLDEAGLVNCSLEMNLSGSMILDLGELNFSVEVNAVLNRKQVASEEYLSLSNYLFLRGLINDSATDQSALESRVEALETKYLYRHSVNVSLQGVVNVWVDIYTRSSDSLANTNAFYQQLMSYGSVPCYENTFRIVNNNTIRSITRLRAIQGDSLHVKVSYFDITYAIVDGALQLTHTAGEEDMQILTFYNDIITRIY